MSDVDTQATFGRPVELSEELWRRMTAAFVAKARRSGVEISDWGLDSLVGTVIADTVLVLDGVLTIEQFEQVPDATPPGHLPFARMNNEAGE